MKIIYMWEYDLALCKRSKRKTLPKKKVEEEKEAKKEAA